MPATTATPVTRLPLQPTAGQRALASPGRALPRDAEVWEIGAKTLRLATSSAAAVPEVLDLRVTLGAEVPDLRAVRVEAAEEGALLGELDVRYGCIFQPFALRLTGAAARAAARQGVRLSTADVDRPVSLLWPLPPLADAAPGLAPHLLLVEPGATTTWSVFDQTLTSLQSLQPFNWLAGCVLDGLQAAGHGTALAAHLDYFFPGGCLRYTGPRGEPRVNEIFGIEALLPFALLPAGHPGIALMAPFVASKLGPDGLLLDRGEDAEGRPRGHTEITVEGCYTLAYPLAVASRRDHRPAWRDLAWAQIAARCEQLVHAGVVAQRTRIGAAPEQRDWARACGWLLLGIARTTQTLGDPPAPIAATFAEVARRALAHQDRDGLWSVYLAEPATGVDTSGSSAIAAALAVGARCKLLPAPAEALHAATRAVTALQAYLAPDGMLGGVAQLNRGGEALQRGGFRVLAPFAMGLLASARAAVGPRN